MKFLIILGLASGFVIGDHISDELKKPNVIVINEETGDRIRGHYDCVGSNLHYIMDYRLEPAKITIPDVTCTLRIQHKSGEV